VTRKAGGTDREVTPGEAQQTTRVPPDAWRQEMSQRDRTTRGAGCSHHSGWSSSRRVGGQGRCCCRRLVLSWGGPWQKSERRGVTAGPRHAPHLSV
jgi:hypothetical protein